MATEGLRRAPEIHGDVEHPPACNSHQFVLREGRGLKMQAANRPDLSRKGMVVLYEGKIESRRLQGPAIVDLREKPPVVAMFRRRKHLQARDFSVFDSHDNPRSS